MAFTRTSKGSGGSNSNSSIVYGGGTVPYPILAQSIGIFNKENAWNSGDSEGWFGLLASSVSGINAQNNSFNTQYSASTVAGISALSRKIKSYAFSNNINTIDSGQIKAALYLNAATNPQNYTSFAEITGPNSFVTFNETTDVLNTVTPIATTITGYKGKGYILISGGNRYILLATAAGGTNSISTFPCNASGQITGVAANTFILPTESISLGATDLECDVIAGINNFGRIITTGRFTQATGTVNELFVSGHLVSINTSGVISLVNTNSKFLNYGNIGDSIAANGFTSRKVGSYVLNNTSYVFFSLVNNTWNGVTGRGRQARGIFTVDLTNTATFTQANVFNENNGNINPGPLYFTDGFTTATVSTGYDGANFIIGDANVWIANGSGFTNLGSATVGGRTLHRYNNSSVKLTTASQNIFTPSNNSISINGSLVTGTLTNLGTGNVFTAQNGFFIYEMTGSNQEDDTLAFKGFHINTTAQASDITAETIPATLTINGTLTQTINNTLFAAQTGNRINTTGPTIGYEHFLTFTSLAGANPIASPSIELELATSNPNARDVKIGFGLIGGNYASPSGTNDASGTVSTAWSIGGNGSQVNLTLTA